jgi:hypothetical protein
LDLTRLFAGNSQLALHYSGMSTGPVHPFGIDIGDFAVESETLPLFDPALACVRASVLNYFTNRNRPVPEDHLVLRFNESDLVSAGDTTLVQQLCVQMGFHRSGSPEQDAADYISGNSPEIMDNYPELGWFRDIVFFLKLMMCPSLEDLPSLCPWEPRDAALQWSSETVMSGILGFRKVEGIRLRVQGFGKHLSAVRPKQANNQGILQRLRLAKLKPRAPQSGADPEIVIGSGICTEDDVLHVANEKLPNFGLRMSHSDTEILCQYLTVPYLRIPLILDFFRFCYLRFFRFCPITNLYFLPPNFTRSLSPVRIFPVLHFLFAN